MTRERTLIGLLAVALMAACGGDEATGPGGAGGGGPAGFGPQPRIVAMGASDSLGVTLGWGLTEGRVVRFGDVEVALDHREVRRAGALVSLTARELDLLAFLVNHPSRVTPRERLLDAVWGYDYAGTERTVDNFIRRLRAKLEASPRRPRHLVTVHGAGYRFDP